MSRLLKLALCGVFVVSSANAADVLVYGPSLAPANCGEGDLLHAAQHVGDPCTTLGIGNPLANEATVAADNGHVVTVVDAAQWAAMTRDQFESYDAIVIGDAGCDFSDGEDTEVLNETRGTWNPAVVGNVTINTFDAFYHIYQDADTEAGARALAGSGIDYAASGDGTGLYYSNGCREFSAGESLGGDNNVTLTFLSGIGVFRLNAGSSSDDITLINPGHPALVGASESNLSFWESSTHAYILQTPSLELLAQGEEDDDLGGGQTSGDVIYAGIPVGGGPSVVEVPTLSGLGLVGFGLLLAALAAVRMRRA